MDKIFEADTIKKCFNARLKALSELIPKVKYTRKDIKKLLEMIEDQCFRNMQAQFDLIKMSPAEFHFNYRSIRQIIINSMLKKNCASVFLESILRHFPKVFSILVCIPLEEMPLYINRGYLGVFTRWRLLIRK
jgi:hypothetical protein